MASQYVCHATKIRTLVRNQQLATHCYCLENLFISNTSAASPPMDYQQSVDQLGFRPTTSVEHAFVVLETVVSKTLEWQCGIWFASLDLRNALHCLRL